MSKALLITECLQNDFVGPIGRFDPLPNLLHVGHAEARRLVGAIPAEGPVARLMSWASERPAEALEMIHIRDWHDPGDPAQEAHLAAFGDHCIAGTQGAGFVFDQGSAPDGAPTVRGRIVDAVTLNDFLHTDLEEALAPLSTGTVRVGLVGVWTEAKITFLAYELHTRFPGLQLAVCSALAASSSRSQHFIALDQLEKLLGVEVFSSVGQFTEFLGGEGAALPLIGFNEKHPRIDVSGDASFREGDEQLLRYLFRDCREASFTPLVGGYSGNLVLGASSVDLAGHQQVPHVVKLGPRETIGQERMAFERIEDVLGNSAPSVTDFADIDDRGAIKYRYAAIGGGFSTTFQKLYQAGMPLERTRRILDTVFREQLGRLYVAGNQERCDLLEYYGFSPRWASRVREKVDGLVGSAAGETLSFPGGRRVENVSRFYALELDRLPRTADTCYFSYIHGDLNGANIIIDGQENVWIIDFYHTHRGHVLKDLIKLENDLLYIFTEVQDEQQLEQALGLTDLLLEVEDLAAPLPEPDRAGLTAAPLLRCYETLSLLRSYYPDLIHLDRDPIQLLIGQLRYAVHTLSFYESSERQKRWALYAASRCGEEISRRIQRRGPLRVDWLPERDAAPGRMGLTILPGRQDLGRRLATDLAALRNDGVTHVLCLLSHREFSAFGVEDLLAEYGRAGLAVRHQPILDQGVCTHAEMKRLVEWIEGVLLGGGRLMVHCVGGLGRSGTVAACYLKSRGQGAARAIAEVRQARSPRAIESALQEQFILDF